MCVGSEFSWHPNESPCHLTPTPYIIDEVGIKMGVFEPK